MDYFRDHFWDDTMPLYLSIHVTLREDGGLVQHDLILKHVPAST